MIGRFLGTAGCVGYGLMIICALILDVSTMLLILLVTGGVI